MQKYLVSISCLLLFLLAQQPMMARQTHEEVSQTCQKEGAVRFPEKVGERVKYDATIEMKKGYLSGICILLREEEGVRGCLFNEFGISALDFIYYPDKEKVKLEGVIEMLDKWYIKKVLRKDLALLMKNLQQGIGTYRDEKYKINYKFSLLKEDAEDSNIINKEQDATEE